MINKQFDITIKGINFTSDKGGFLNLNDIWRGFELPQSKRPNQWKSELRKSFFETGNITSGEKHRVVDGVTTNLKEKYLLADEEDTIGYAMFISVHFYREVVTAFVELRQGNLLEAAKIADSTQIESKAFSSWLEMEDGTIQQALNMLGIVRPNFFQALINKPSQKTSFLDRGILKQRNYGTHGVALRMTSFGKSYILDNRDTINDTIERLYQESKIPVM